MFIKKRSIYFFSVMSILGLSSPLLASDLDRVPPPASAHSTTDMSLLRLSSGNDRGILLDDKKKPVPHSDTAGIRSEIIKEKVSVQEPVQEEPQKIEPKKMENEAVNPYLLEKQYGITSKSTTTKKNTTTITQKTEPVKTIPQKSTSTIKTVTETEHNPLVDEEGSWQASSYRFSPEFNKVQYPADSPLKMITLQLMVEMSSGGAGKARELLTKINNALPNALLIAGLRELHTKEVVYPLAQWERDKLAKAIKNISARKQTGTIGYGLQEVRPTLLNIPYPLAMLLITDGEHVDIENLGFDTKIFYAPDPRSPLHIVSFAKTKDEKNSIRVLQQVHKGTYVFDGFKLLKDEAAFAAFMKALFVK